MQSTKIKAWKKLCGCFIVIFGVLVIIVASLKNPSKADSETHLTFMIKDMDKALTAGGNVDSVYSNARFGGALLIKHVKAASWTPALPDEYQRILLMRGWKKRSGATEPGISLCKDGVLARIDVTPSTDASRGAPQLVFGFSMSYNLSTRKSCIP
jgi:hypothetical protein